MGNIPEFNLPSNPALIVRLREATVSDAIDFSGVADQSEQVATSLFLDRVQYDKARWSDPKKWTGEDRVFALYWYWLHTEKDHEVALTFPCSVCGETHVQLVDFRTFADTYTNLQGKAERDIEFEGFKITVHPLTGEDLEELESRRIAVEVAEKKHGKDSGQAKQERTRLSLVEVVLSMEFSDEPKDGGRAFREKRIEGFTVSQFEEFASKVFDARIDMAHGLESETVEGKITIITPPVPCPTNPQEVGTRLRVPFRNSEYIPRVF